ncbi:unnamed protein product, partial [Ectocarpus sp. 12 AP-2014]
GGRTRVAGEKVPDTGPNERVRQTPRPPQTVEARAEGRLEPSWIILSGAWNPR